MKKKIKLAYRLESTANIHWYSFTHTRTRTYSNAHTKYAFNIYLFLLPLQFFFCSLYLFIPRFIPHLLLILLLLLSSL